MSTAEIVTLAEAHGIDSSCLSASRQFISDLSLAAPMLSSPAGVWTMRSCMWTEDHVDIATSLAGLSTSGDTKNTVWDDSWRTNIKAGRKPWAYIPTPRAVFGLGRPEALRATPLDALVLAALQVGAVKDSFTGGPYIELGTLLSAMPRPVNSARYDVDTTLTQVTNIYVMDDTAGPWYANVVTVGVLQSVPEALHMLEQRVAQVFGDERGLSLTEIAKAQEGYGEADEPYIMTQFVSPAAVAWLAVLPLLDGMKGLRKGACHVAGVSNDVPSAASAAAYALLRGILSRAEGRVAYVPRWNKQAAWLTTIGWGDAVRRALQEISVLDCGVTHHEKHTALSALGLPLPTQSLASRLLEARRQTPAHTEQGSAVTSGSSLIGDAGWITS